MDKPTRRMYIRGVGAATAVGLAGCLSGGGGGNGNNGNSDNNGNGGKVGNSKGSNSITFEFWHVFEGSLKNAIESMCADYNRITDGVTVKPITQGSYKKNLNQSLQANRAGNPPGLTQIYEIGTRLCIDSGGFTPVNEIIPKDEINLDDFLTGVKSYYTINDKLHSMPFNSSNAIMLYNKSVFEEAGLDPEDAPRSLAGVTEAAQTIVDQTKMDKAITWPNHSWMQVEQEFAKQNQVLINKKNGRGGTPTKSLYNSEAGRNVYNWWKDLTEKGLYINPGIEAWTAARQAFLTEKVAMLWDSTSNIAPMQKSTEKSGFELGTEYLPTPNAANTGVVVGGGSLWVPSGNSDEKKEAIGEFLAYLTAPEQQAFWHKNSGYFPISKSAIDLLRSNGWFETHPDFKTAFAQLKDTKPTPATAGALMGVFPKARRINEQVSVQIINDELSVEEGLNKMEKEVNSALANYEDYSA